MSLSKSALRIRFQNYCLKFNSIGLAIERSRIVLAEHVLQSIDFLESGLRYLLRSIMKSSSKKPDLAGTSERRDLRIFGNLYGTSQHPYVKHFRKCFTLSVGLFKDRQGPSILIVPDVAVAAYSSGLFLGTPAPLNAHAKNLNKLTIESVSVFPHRTLIQLFECAAQLSALLINVNAYLQLVVEVGKRAAGAVIQFKKKTHEIRRTHSTASLTPSTSADQIRTWKNLERTINICRRCYLNRTGFPRSGSTLLEAQFSCS